MKGLILIFADGARHLATVVSADFDTQRWAESRREAFAMLQVVKVEEHAANRSKT